MAKFLKIKQINLKLFIYYIIVAIITRTNNEIILINKKEVNYINKLTIQVEILNLSSFKYLSLTNIILPLDREKFIIHCIFHKLYYKKKIVSFIKRD